MIDRDGFLDRFKAIITKKPTRHQLHLRRQVMSWKSKLSVCREHYQLLSLREQSFVNDLHEKWLGRDLSEKQGRWLNAIYDRLVLDHCIYD